MHSQYRFLIILFLALSFRYVIVAQPPASYYNAAAGLTGAPLKTALYNIIKGHTAVTYDNAYVRFQTTDKKANGKVWDMYSDVPGGTPAYEYSFVVNQCGSYNSEGDCFNREHSFPASWYNDAAPMYTDLFQLIPTDGYVNGRRSNYPLAKVGTATWTSTNGSRLGNCATVGYTGVVFEPIDAYKGDFARMMFYMATRYENVVGNWAANSTNAAAVLLSNSTYPTYKSWYLTMLGQWHTADPVSAKEIARNNAIYTIQGNRNPFIDNPSYVFDIWGVGSSMAIEPSAHVTNLTAATITLQWSESTGTYLPEAYLVRMGTSGYDAIAVPADGTPVATDQNNRNIAYGVGKVIFGNLTPNQTYYFKIFPYRGSGATIDYKTDGTIQQVSIIAR